MPNYQIQPFSQYILRTPSLPIATYLNLLEDYSEESILSFIENPFVREAIHIASPELLSVLDKWKANPSELSDDKKKALEITLLKYIARISSRCTPFGLFAGCSVGSMSSETNIVLAETQKFTRFTQFDMHFWVAMLQEFVKKEDVRKKLKYFPNNSIYKLGDFYRYVEYKYVKTKREHSISALRKSELLDELLSKSKLGMTIDELLSFITEDDSEMEEALLFINQLIGFQFLVSELDASITSNDEWTKILTTFSQIPTLKQDFQLLKSIKKDIVNLDKTLIPTQKDYENIKNKIRELGIDYDDKFLFQTDLNIVNKANDLDKKVSRKILQALYFLNGIQKKAQLNNQSQFIKAFLERYESREMPLTTVLDTEIGIGYLQHSNMNDTHDLLDQFSFKGETQEMGENQFWTTTNRMLQQKIKDCQSKNEKVILLSEKDYPDFESNWDDVPSTFSVMVEVAKVENEEIISIVSSGGVSAAKLLGRFCSGNTDMNMLTNEIVEKEKQYHSDKLLAEIVHIPESRTGNILRRPVLRDNEIAYLSNSGVDKDWVLDLTDLRISIKNSKIVLRSQKHNKEVIPCLSNAHNYSGNSLPIYHFLCDLQSQGLKPIYGFDWGILESHYDFFPSVKYKEVILSKAKWIVSQAEINQFYTMTNSKLFDAFYTWRNERNIPQYVNWVQSDNTLLLDFEKEICVQMFLKSVQHLFKITLEEFLFTGESLVKDVHGADFANQIILSFYKQSA